MMKPILTGTIVLSMLACSAQAATSPVVRRNVQFKIFAALDGQPTEDYLQTLVNHDRVFYTDDPLAFHTTTDETFHGGRGLAGIDDHAGTWNVRANLLADGISFHFDIDPPELPDFERTAFVPYPETWHEPLSVGGLSVDGDGMLVVDEPRGPWHWPDAVLLDETIEWTYTYSDPSQGCVRCEEIRTRHYFAKLESFGWWQSVNYMDQGALDGVLANWGASVDGELVDQGELDRVLSNWGGVARPSFVPPQVDPFATLDAAAVPEPPSWGIVAVILLMALPLRRIVRRQWPGGGR